MLYRNIEIHEAGFDYEFEEGEVVNITYMWPDNEGLDFLIDGNDASATIEEFEAAWSPIIDNKSVKDLQKKWRDRIERDKKFLPVNLRITAESVVACIYEQIENCYSRDYKYDMHATYKAVAEHISEMPMYLASIYNDFLTLWFAQHM